VSGPDARGHDGGSGFCTRASHSTTTTFFLFFFFFFSSRVYSRSFGLAGRSLLSRGSLGPPFGGGQQNTSADGPDAGGRSEPADRRAEEQEAAVVYGDTTRRRSRRAEALAAAGQAQGGQVVPRRGRHSAWRSPFNATCRRELKESSATTSRPLLLCSRSSAAKKPEDGCSSERPRSRIVWATWMVDVAIAVSAKAPAVDTQSDRPLRRRAGRPNLLMERPIRAGKRRTKLLPAPISLLQFEIPHNTHFRGFSHAGA